jgi:hypothetical protein
MYQWLLNGQEFDFSIELEDNLGNVYLLWLPRCKMSEDAINVSGGDEDVMHDATYVALADNDVSAQIIIYKFPAPTNP